MKSIFPYLLPVASILIFLLGKAPKKSASSNESSDFIRKASESINGPEVPVVSASFTEAPDGVDYNYDAVGESFQRDHLTELIGAHNASESGEIYPTAVLELEPTNPFDPNAVKVVIGGTEV